MDMTIAEVEAMQKQSGVSKMATDNLDKNKTVRQVLEEQKQMNAAKQQMAAIQAHVAAPYEPQGDPWNASSAWNAALGQNANSNPQHAPSQNQRSPRNPQRQQQRYPPRRDFGGNGNGNGQSGKGGVSSHGRPRSWSDESAGSGGNVHLPQRPNYNQPRPFKQQYPPQQRAQNAGPRMSGPNRFPAQSHHGTVPFNPAQQKLPKAFQAMAGFKPAAAGGLSAKSVGQKMGPQGLQHRDVRRPQHNPWGQPGQKTTKWSPNGNNGNGSNATDPGKGYPPPPQSFEPQYEGHKYEHNFKSKGYDKRAARKRARHRKGKPSYPPPEKLDMDGAYDSDESVFVAQAEIARRHSWGSSSLEPTQNKQPFGKPVYVDDVERRRVHPAVTQSDEERVAALELSEKKFYQKYWIEDGTVGTGSFAKVRKVTRKEDKKEFALKMIKKAGKSKEDLEALQKEIAILAKLDHPNVVKLMSWCQTKKRIYMVVQFCSGGDVFERILKQKTFSEKEAAHVVRKVAEGLAHVHEHGIVHRDLKPDNLMYLSKAESSNIMLIDFGLAGDLSNGSLSTPCGTAHYVAPEVLMSKAYDCKADMWSLGVIIYMLLCGFPPFFDAQGNQKRLYKLIKLGKYRFPSPYWDYVSENAKDLVRRLLVLDPTKRFSAKQTLAHQWVHQSAEIEEVDLGKLYMEQMEHFSSSRKFVDAGLQLHHQGPPGPGGPPPNVKKATPSFFANPQYAPKYDEDAW